MIGTTELILIAGVALLLFGGKKLPELMRGMGQGIKSFKEGLNSPVEEKDREPENSVKAKVAEDSSKKSATENTFKETTAEALHAKIVVGKKKLLHNRCAEGDED